jgi:hypothetical protein
MSNQPVKSKSKRATVKSRAKATPNARKTRARAPVNSNKIMAKLQELLDKYNRAYELVQKKMVECERDLKLLDEYMKRELKAKEEYDAYAEKYRAILEGAGTKM